MRQHPGQLLLKARLHRLLKPQVLIQHWPHWQAILRQEALLEAEDFSQLADASDICESFWQHTQNFYLGKPFRGAPVHLMNVLESEDALERLHHMAGNTNCLWDAVVLAAYLPKKAVNRCLKHCEPGYQKQFFATLHMLEVYPAFLQHHEVSPCIKVYTDGGLIKKRAAWAFHLPAFNITQSGIAQGIKKSNEAEAVAIQQAVAFIQKHYPGQAICVYTDCLSLCEQWQDGYFKKLSPLLNMLFTDNFITLRWCSKHTPGIAIADEACTRALYPARTKARASFF